jgi:hypothetical protein
MECKKKRIFQDTHIAVDDIKKKKIVSLDDVTSEEVYDGSSRLKKLLDNALENNNTHSEKKE